MDMVLIYMGADDKGMVSFCEFQRQLPADLIGFFRCNFTGLKCLTEMVGDHIICTLVSAGQICILSFGQKKLCISKPGITLIAINEFSKIGFLRIFYIINNICNRSRSVMVRASPGLMSRTSPSSFRQMAWKVPMVMAATARLPPRRCSSRARISAAA